MANAPAKEAAPVIQAIWWERLLEMPFVEAEQMILSEKQRLLFEKQAIDEETNRTDIANPRSMAIQNTITKLNQELRRIRVLEDKYNLRTAITAIYGREGWVKINEWIEMHKGRGLTDTRQRHG